MIKITKDIIFSSLDDNGKPITEESIFIRYLGIQKLIFNKLFKNPLRVDEHPTCSLNYGKDNRLRLVDWSGFTNKGNKRGWDCFDLVEYCINSRGGAKVEYFTITGEHEFCNIKLDIGSFETIELGKSKVLLRKISFDYILRDIAKVFNINFYDPFIEEITNIKQVEIPFKKKETIITANLRNWNNNDNDYWRKKYNIDVTKDNVKAIMMGFKIYPVDKAFINDKLIYFYTKNDRCYAYYISTVNNIKHIQLYFPDRNRETSLRFITNTNSSDVFGLNSLQPGSVGIITKAFKDIRLLYDYIAGDTPIRAIAPPSESVVIQPDIWYRIKYYCDTWYTLFDYDYAGVRLAILYYKRYNILPLFFINKDKPLKYSAKKQLIREFNTKYIKDLLSVMDTIIYFDGKDFSDNVELLGKDKMQNLITSLEPKYLYNYEYNRTTGEYCN